MLGSYSYAKSPLGVQELRLLKMDLNVDHGHALVR